MYRGATVAHLATGCAADARPRRALAPIDSSSSRCQPASSKPSNISSSPKFSIGASAARAVVGCSRARSDASSSAPECGASADALGAIEVLGPCWKTLDDPLKASDLLYRNSPLLGTRYPYLHSVFRFRGKVTPPVRVGGCVCSPYFFHLPPIEGSFPFRGKPEVGKNQIIL